MRSLVFTLSLLAFFSQTQADDYEGDDDNPALGRVLLSYVVPVSIKIVDVSQANINLAAEDDAERSVTCSLQSNAPYATLKITSQNDFVLKNVIATTANLNDSQHGEEDYLEYEVNATINNVNMDTSGSDFVANVHALKYGDQNVKLTFKLKDRETAKNVVGGEYRDVLIIKLEAQSEVFDASSHSSTESPMS